MDSYLKGNNQVYLEWKLMIGKQSCFKVNGIPMW
ncbi:hypothetical protein Pan241w_21600 [Gimesia alba]|uniref:Uncharacterized protein n=1 Tax=Gimesia alba TaxID=2527973 RepID=A0A517RDX9_9PLAN|nr:hypothetical protein Pan241w_21600 [Gimesia alba]